MEWKVPLSGLNFDEKEVRAAADTVASGWLSSGPRVEEFELEFARLHGSRNAIAVSSGTAALHLACVAAGFGPGDEVLCPSLTFVATANAIRYTGATPVLVDIESPEFPWISIEDCKRKITSATKGMIAVHFAGYPAPLDRLRDLCSTHDLLLIEDAAHTPLTLCRDSFGAGCKGRFLGTVGFAGCFSFYPNKNMTTGEGGIFLTEDDELAAKIRVLRSHGMSTVTIERHAALALSYDVTDLGYNYRLDEIRAAIGIEQLRKISAANQRRHDLAQKYYSLLSTIEGVQIPFKEYEGPAAHHIFPILLKPEITSRDDVMLALRDEGIQTSVHYPPIHLFSAFRDFYKTDSLPVTEDYAGRTLTLPLFDGLTDEQQKLVIQALDRAVSK